MVGQGSCKNLYKGSTKGISFLMLEQIETQKTKYQSFYCFDLTFFQCLHAGYVTCIGERRYFGVIICKGDEMFKCKKEFFECMKEKLPNHLFPCFVSQYHQPDNMH